MSLLNTQTIYEVSCSDRQELAGQKIGETQAVKFAIMPEKDNYL